MAMRSIEDILDSLIEATQAGKLGWEPELAHRLPSSTSDWNGEDAALRDEVERRRCNQ